MNPARARLAAICAAGAAAVAGCSSSDSAPERTPQIPPSTRGPCGETSWPEGYGGWEVVCASAEAGHFLSVWGSSPNDVYLAGGTEGSTAIWHWDGTELKPLENPGAQRAWWVFGSDADHVWVVGEKGLGLYRENRGDFVPFDTGTNQTIYGLWAGSPEELWYVSGDFAAPGGRGLIHVRTGSGAPAIVEAPVLDRFDGAALFKVWGSDGEIFAVGEGGAIFRRSAGTWSRLDSIYDGPVLTASGFGARELYAVGGRGRGAILGWDGARISDLTPADRPLPGLMGIHAGAGARLLISGENGFLGELTSGVVHEEPQYTSDALHAVWGHEGGGAWAVGGNLADVSGSPRGVILRKPSTICPEGGIQGAGYHHLDLQGRGAMPLADGSYPMFAVPRGEIHPELVHGEHYLLGPGAFVDFTVPLCADLSDRVAFRLANNDDPGSVALHQLFVVRGDKEILIAEARDDVPGNFGYLPFDRSSLPDEEEEALADVDTSPTSSKRGWAELPDAPDFETRPKDVLARAGDTLLFRSTNLSTQMYGLMVWFPQDGLEYQSFLEVHVPEVPGGEDGDARPPPPVPGPCEAATAERFVELGAGEAAFTPAPPAEVKVEPGPQGSLMFVVAVRGRGFAAGDPERPSADENPLLLIRLALDAPPEEGGRIVADGFWRRGFEVRSGELQLLGVRPTVPVGAAIAEELDRATIYAEVKLVEPDGATLCARARFTARR